MLAEYPCVIYSPGNQQQQSTMPSQLLPATVNTVTTNCCRDFHHIFFLIIYNSVYNLRYFLRYFFDFPTLYMPRNCICSTKYLNPVDVLQVPTSPPRIIGQIFYRNPQQLSVGRRQLPIRCVLTTAICCCHFFFKFPGLDIYQHLKCCLCRF